ncbi:NAD(P)/FAD-dependent oxidoreductase [Planosporangium flavigriseum]|uniref:Pyridine nucleotide-disulfide oxidoreductase domain-containing protein 2 n=1 Tax=Planosporangium flavigriseum TaxID=373681 RepID=A0A8J3LYK7_9ACTN|nr:NAD(P)/FAD-dependent oxidoreductase [Planosporangium flavigriseum]NJC65421.1 NAD(P)/FAD-dependent oxidoreductase [Planosporangium flavigriseum]GIG75891.1 FAD-dependent oxidoreductase [Planosporangium flavigriseum]
MGETVDAVVIGAGPNGLVAANMLVDAGWDVIVLEATDHLGGAVRSAPLAAPGFLSDVCSSFYPLGYASPPLAALRLDEYGLRWTNAPHVLAHLLPDGRAAVLDRDLDVTAASLEEFAPGDGRRWRSEYARWAEVSDELLGALLTPFPPVRPGLALYRRLRTAGLLRLARWFLLPARILGEEMFEGEGGRALLAGLALHTNLSPVEVGSGVYGWLLAMLGQQYGFPVPVGGAGRLADALVDRLRARGGEILLDAPVDRVIVGAGRALGVRSADGRHWRARRAVLADVPAPALFLDLVGADRLPDRFVDDLRHFRWDDATIKVDWALSGPVPWVNEAARRAGTVHLRVDTPGLVDFSADLAAGRVPERPFVLVGQMTTADPTRSPAGTEAMWAYTHVPRREKWTAADIDRHVERIERVIEQSAPGFRDLVIGRHVTGPERMEAENPSLVGGAINGGTAALYQLLFLRPVPGLGRADTPVDKLYLASASAHPGGGVHGGPGANAARAALARHRVVAGDLYAAGVKAAQRAVYS